MLLFIYGFKDRMIFFQHVVFNAAHAIPGLCQIKMIEVFPPGNGVSDYTDRHYTEYILYVFFSLVLIFDPTV